MNVQIVMLIGFAVIGSMGFLFLYVAKDNLKRPEVRGDYMRGKRDQIALETQKSGWVFILMSVLGLILFLTTEFENGEVKRDPHQECLRDCKSHCSRLKDGGEDRGVQGGSELRALHGS